LPFVNDLLKPGQGAGGKRRAIERSDAADSVVATPAPPSVFAALATIKTCGKAGE